RVGTDGGLTRLHVEARTNRVVDVFWNLRAQSWSDVDAVTLRTRVFEYDRRVNGRPELTRIEADGDGLLVGRYSRPGRYHLIEVNAPNALAPSASVLRARRELPNVGGTASYPVFTGEARYRIDLHVGAMESITVPAGRFAAARLEPTVWRSDREGR